MQARERLGWSQKKLADAAHFSATIVGRWERNETEPRGSSRMVIANTLGVHDEWIRTGKGPMLLTEGPEPAQTEETIEGNLASMNKGRFGSYAKSALADALRKEAAALNGIIKNGLDRIDIAALCSALEEVHRAVSALRSSGRH